MEIFKCGSVSPVGKVEPAKPVWLRLLHLSHRKKFNTDFEVNPIDCEGCGVCVYFCPEKAINFPHQQSWGYEAGPSKGPGLCSAGGR